MGRISRRTARIPPRKKSLFAAKSLHFLPFYGILLNEYAVLSGGNGYGREKNRTHQRIGKEGTPEGLTPAEKEEQNALRTEYRQSVVGNLKGQLNNTVVIRPDGSSYRPADKKKSK